MLNKTIFQGFFILVVFFGLWFGLSKVDFVGFFQIQKHSDSAENFEENSRIRRIYY